MKRIIVFLIISVFLVSLSAVTVVEDRIGLLSPSEKEYVKEKLEIVKPFDSKIGKFFAKIINSIITIFEWFLRKK